MANITSYSWTFSNGITSDLPSPIVMFTPGVYDVALSVTLDNGDTVTTTEVGYIVVTEDKQNMLSSGYLDHSTPGCRAVSYHYGNRASTASGWSRNSGEHWIWPESQPAISHEELNGIDNLLVWNLYDDYQYCINPRNTVDSPVTHLDKEEHEIPCSVTFPGVTGESKSFDIMHQESRFHVRKDIDSKTVPVGMTITTSLIGSNDEVLESKECDADVEVVFKEQSVYNYGEHKVVQLKFETDKSGFLLSGVDSMYKVDDKMRISSVGQAGDTASIMANVSYWLSYKHSYAYEIVNYTEIANTGFAYVTGPDGRSGSAVRCTTGISFYNEAYDSCSLVFWAKDPTGFGNMFTEVMTKNGFILYYYNGSIPENIGFASGISVYDFRIFADAISADTLTDYGNNLMLHVTR